MAVLAHDDWRRLIYARDGGYCQWCGGVGTDPHHIKFRSLGGKDEPENGILLCRRCHGRAQKNEITVEQLKNILRKRGLLGGGSGRQAQDF